MRLMACLVLLTLGCGSNEEPASAVDAGPGSSSEAGPGGERDAGSESGADGGSGSSADTGPAQAMDSGEPVASLDVTGEDLDLCMNDWPQVRLLRITNLLGDVDSSVAVAESPTGGMYPPGTLIQLFPGEAMLKREVGWNPTTNDWEFFALDVQEDGVTITARGAEDTVNMFGGNCFDCHRLAEPQWDFVCGEDNGCNPLPIGEDFIRGLQESDARCR